MCFFLSHMSINEDLLVLIYLQVASNKVGQQIDSWSEFNLDSDKDSDCLSKHFKELWDRQSE